MSDSRFGTALYGQRERALTTKGPWHYTATDSARLSDVRPPDCATLAKRKFVVFARKLMRFFVLGRDERVLGLADFDHAAELHASRDGERAPPHHSCCWRPNSGAASSWADDMIGAGLGRGNGPHLRNQRRLLQVGCEHSPSWHALSCDIWLALLASGRLPH
eukprot:2437422-Rhodomonas_salina.2